MSINTILLSDFTDSRFRAVFQTYFAELDITVRDWDGLFREMDEEKTNLAYLALDGEGNAAGFLMFQPSTTGFLRSPSGSSGSSGSPRPYGGRGMARRCCAWRRTISRPTARTVPS